MTDDFQNALLIIISAFALVMAFAAWLVRDVPPKQR